MSWLASGLTQSVTGRISQISGQLKDILTEGTEEIYDPENELKVVSEKLKENEKRLELMKMECARWEDETNELNQRCQSYESQIEQKQNEHRQTLISKDALIAELRSQINLLEARTSDLSSHGYQKSAFMEEYEEVMPSSDLNNYIHLDKEIKRLKEDNLHLQNENRDLLAKIKLKNQQLEESKTSETDRNLLDEKIHQVEALKQEIVNLKKIFQVEKDTHEKEVINLQNSYKENVNVELVEKQSEIDNLNRALDELRNEFENYKISSEINQEIVKQNEEIAQNLELNLKNKSEEIDQLKSQIEMFEAELEQANSMILKLKTETKKTPDASPSKEQIDLNEKLKIENQSLEKIIKENDDKISNLQSDLQNLTLQLKNFETDLESKNSEIEDLKSKINDLNDENDVLKSLNSTQETQLVEKQSQVDELNRKIIDFDVTNDNEKTDQKQKEIEALQLELKQQQQSLQQEKMLQLQEQKQDRQELAKLKSENTELKIKLDEKLSEITLLCQQINDLNSSINQLKSNDSNLFHELKTKTEQFLAQIDSANNEISLLKSEREQFIEQRKQFEFVLEEKTREISQLKVDMQKNMQHISAQSKAIEKLQDDLKTDETKSVESEELALLKNQYNQIYTYLEQKNQESLSYYNEIQRLNLVISELNHELFNAKKLNENLSEQYDTLLKGFQLEQKMVDDLNEQTSELNTHLLSIKAETDQQKLEAKNDEKFNQIIDELSKEKEELTLKLKQLQEYYESMLDSQASSFDTKLANEEQQRDKLKRELDKLKEHLVEMSDSYTNQAIEAEEREKQLRSALTSAQNQLQQQGVNLENSSKEVAQRVQELSQANQNLMKDKETLRDKLKQTEESLNHQVKVTKNLELVLERLQNEKDGQHQLEIAKFQQTIKDQSVKIHQLQKENKNYQDEIKKLNETLDAINTLELELNEKEEEIKKLKAEIGTKDALIESLEKRFNETQKINETYIGKEIIKNLIIGYIKVPQVHEKKQVLKLISTMLNFSPSELEQAEQASESKWFGGLLSKSTPVKNSKNPSTDGKSFTELLIQYVDKESRPKPNLQFDLNKKTDSPLNDSLNSSSSSTNLPSSESALQFFTSINTPNPDLTLVNRSTNATNPIVGISSPAVANSFLEQILK